MKNYMMEQQNLVHRNLVYRTLDCFDEVFNYLHLHKTAE